MGKKKEIRQVEVPYWLVEQFKITGGDAGEIPEGLKYDEGIGFDVGTFDTKTHGLVKVEFEASSGQHNWWNAINVWSRKGQLISQSDPGTDLLGLQEYHLDDGTVIQFEVVAEPGPRDWSPRKKKPAMSGPTMGLDTAEERQHARALALQMVALAREGDPIMRAEARGYVMAVRDLAVDEGAEELAIEMARLLEEMK